MDDNDGDDNEEHAGFLGDDEGDEEDDLAVDAICNQLKERPREGKETERKRPRLEVAESSWNGRDLPEVTSFDELVQVTRGKLRTGLGMDGAPIEADNRPGDILFWSQGIIGMTVLDAVNRDRPEELRRLLCINPHLANSEEPTRHGNVTGVLSMLQKAVHLGHWECVKVLIKAGAEGALDILRTTESDLRLKALPYLVPGCTREELRDMECERLKDGKMPVARLLAENIRLAKSYRSDPTWVPHSKRLDEKHGSPILWQLAFMLWIARTGADDFRDRKGESLQDYAFFAEHWSIFYLLQRRAMLTLMCVHHWTYNVNRAFCRIPTDVLLTHIVPLIYAPAYCFACGEGVRSNRVCGGCRVTPIPCNRCRGRYRAEKEHVPYAYPLCDGCGEPVCRDCSNECLARPVMEDCDAVFCTRCAPGTCEDCVETQIRMNRPSSPSSSEEEERYDMRGSSFESSSASSSSGEEEDEEAAEEKKSVAPKGVAPEPPLLNNFPCKTFHWALEWTTDSFTEGEPKTP